MTLIIPDLSHYEKITIEPAALRTPALINKVSQGSDFSDSTWFNRARDIVQHGELIGGYHFCTNADPSAQVSLFLKDVRNSLGAVVMPQLKLALDWEDYPQAQCSQTQAETMAAAIEVVTGKLPLFYTNLAKYQTITPGSLLLSCDLWLAEYGPTAKVPCQLWQFTDSYGGFEGVNVPCDASKWAADVCSLTDWWAK